MRINDKDLLLRGGQLQTPGYRTYDKPRGGGSGSGGGGNGTGEGNGGEGTNTGGVETPDLSDLLGDFNAGNLNGNQGNGNRGYYVNTGNQPYMNQLNALYDQIVNRKPFQYDLNGDLLYRQYADQYDQLGQQAMRNTMGQAAALTGGYGNSYAQQVGNQAYQQYLTQLNAMVPEFWDRAFKAWQAEGDDLTNRYKLAAAHPSYLQSMQPRYVSGGGGSDKKGDGAKTGTTDGEKTGWYDTLNQYAQGILGLMGTGNAVNGQAYNPIAGIYDAQSAEDKKKK